MERDLKKHIKEDRLEAYAMNLLAGNELATVEEHLLFCETCQDQMQAVESYVKAMRSAALRAREEADPPPIVSRALKGLKRVAGAPLPMWFGAAVMALLLLLVRLPVHERPGVPVDVELQAVRGESMGTALAGHALNLKLDNRGVPYLPAWRVDIVDSEGAKVWTGNGTWSDTAIKVTVPQSFEPGTYFVRLVTDAEDPVREFQLLIK